MRRQGVLAVALALGIAAVAQKAGRQAPTPADWAALAKLPDLTGVWETAPGGGAGQAKGGKGKAAKGGGGRAGAPQLTPEYAAKAEAQARRPRTEDNQTANCLPPGVPGIMGQPYPIEILLTPGKVTIVIEAYTQVRHIYTDGRGLPADPNPTFFGTSVGRWEEDTLVVETVGLAEVARGIPFPYSDQVKIRERFRLADPDNLTIETVITDPKALAAPYSAGTRNYRRYRNWTIAEYICQENNRNFVDEKGKAGIILANPGASAR
jgi:hypothetical protein